MDSDRTPQTPARTYAGRSATQRAQSRRELLLAAAREIIAESGVAAVTAEAVCRRAGLTKRYFYVDFSSKDDLLCACADELYSRLRAAVDAALSAAPPTLRIRALPQAVVRTIASDPGAARLYAESPAFPRLRERQQRAIRDFSALLPMEPIPATDISASDGIHRDLTARILAAGSTEAIVAWLQGEIDCDEDTLIATIAAVAEGAALTD